MKTITHEDEMYVFPKNNRRRFNDEFERLLNKFSPLIQKKAVRMSGKRRWYGVDDWVAVGQRILFEAISSWNPNKVCRVKKRRTFFSYFHWLLRVRTDTHQKCIDQISKAGRTKDPGKATPLELPYSLDRVNESQGYEVFGYDKQFDWEVFLGSLSKEQRDLVDQIVVKDKRTRYKLRVVRSLRKNAYLQRLALSLIPNLS